MSEDKATPLLEGNKDYQTLLSRQNTFYISFIKKYDKMHTNLEFKCKTTCSKDVNAFVTCHRGGKKALVKAYKEYQAYMAFQDMQLQTCQAKVEGSVDGQLQCLRTDLKEREGLLDRFTKQANQITYF